MAQTPITATVDHDSDTVAVGEDLSSLALPASFLLGDYQTALPVQAFLPPGGDQGWRARLAARYAGPARNGVPARLHTQFTPGGQPLYDVGDTGTRPLLNQQSLAIENLLQSVRAMAAATALAVLPVASFGGLGGAADDTAAFNAAMQAARDLGGGRVTFTKAHRITAGLINDQDNVILDGVGVGRLIADFADGDVIHFAAPAPADITDPNGGLNGVAFIDFTITAPGPRNSGAAIYTSWTRGLICRNVVVGAQDINPGSTLTFQDGLILERQGVALVENCSINARRRVLAVSGHTNQSNAFSVGGIISGCTLYSNNAAGSRGFTMGGACGGLTVINTDIGHCEQNLRVDKSMTNETNRELFLVGPDVTPDSAGNQGVYVAPASLNIFNWTGVWAAGSGLSSGSSTPEDGAGVVVNGPCQVHWSGGNIYANAGHGAVFQNGVQALFCGVHSYQNGRSGVRVASGSVLSVVASDLTINAVSGLDMDAPLAVLIAASNNANQTPTTGTAPSNYRVSGVLGMADVGGGGGGSGPSPNAGVTIPDRDDADAWLLYAMGNLLRLYRQGVDIWQIDQSGAFHNLLATLGSAAGVKIGARDGGTDFTLYNTANLLRWFTGADVMTLTPTGVLRALGGYLAGDGTVGATETLPAGKQPIFKNGLYVGHT